MENLDVFFEQVYKRLQDGLSPFLTYHTAKHTEFVVGKAAFLCDQEGVIGREKELAMLAALYHDIGFLIGAENHEERACSMVRSEMKDLDLSPAELEAICGMIEATKIPQRPSNLTEMIVADADLFYIGTDRYEIVSEKLYIELLHAYPSLDRTKWLDIQIQFLSAHQYHTNFAKTHLAPMKKINLDRLLSAS